MSNRALVSGSLLVSAGLLLGASPLAGAAARTGPTPTPTPTRTATTAPGTGASASATGTTAAAVTATVAPGAIWDPIPYGQARRNQMAEYSAIHYGERTASLTSVRQVVLHYTVSSTYSSVKSLFAANQKAHNPTGGYSYPGTCTHFVIDRDGRTYQLVPLDLKCRHAVGLNHRSIGIEFVEPRSADNVLNRPKQLAAGVKLVRWLQAKYGIGASDVIGHGMVNNSRYFLDKARGWRNTHVDWNSRQVAAFRRNL